MNAYPQQLRDISIKLYKSGNYTKQALSDLLSVGYKTLRNWIKEYQETGVSKVTRPSIIGRKRLFDNKQIILDYLITNPDADGKELHKALAPNVSRACFYNTLNRLGITYKKGVVYKKRCEKKRAEFIEEIKQLAINNLIYIDETGIDNNIAPIRGWAERGCKSLTEALGFRTKRTTLIAGYCYATKDLVAPMEYDGYTNTEVFLTWIEQRLCKELKPGQYVIMDNATFHKSDKVQALLESVGCNLIYLPAYSPDLNPIEHVWANLKRLIRRHPHKEQNLSSAISDSIGLLFMD